MENFIKIVRISNYHMRMLTSTIRIPALSGLEKEHEENE